MTSSHVCSKCGGPLGSDTLAGLCRECMLVSALGPDPDTPSPAVEEEDAELAPLPLSSVVSRFGDYELQEELAHGGMGVIYKARQVHLDRIVAIKMLLLGQRASEEVVERFKREAQSAARLRHPHIVAIHEVGEVEGQPFFSMDYIQGKDLAQIVRESPLPARRAATYLRAVAEAIHYAHQQGIIHRDLKPSNILIDFATDEVRVTDFGLAKRLDDDSDLTLSGQVLGSPNHMAPELAAGHHRLASPASDVFSLGAILYDLLTGRPPFLADSLQATLLKIRDTDPVAPRTLHEGIPRDLETICLKCLEKEPGARFGSAQELADELGRFLRGEPIRTRPINLFDRTWRWCRRNPAFAGLAGAIVVLALVSTVTAIGLGVSRQRQQREQYYAEISLAKHHIEEGNIDLALQKLMRCPPDQRHWEWGRLLYLCHQDISTIQAHTNVISVMDLRTKNWVPSMRWLGFAPDGDVLVTIGADGTAKAWAVPDGSFLHSWGSPSNQVTAVAFSPDGSRLAAVEGNEVRLRDAHRGEIVLGLPDLPKPAHHLAWSPQGQRLAVGLSDGTIHVYEASSGAQVCSIPKGEGPISRLFYTPDGARLVREEVRCCTAFDDLSGQERGRLAFTPEQAYAIAADPEMRRVVSVDQDEWATLWEEDQPVRLQHRARGGRNVTPLVVFSPDGQRFVSRGGLAAARVWDVAARRPIMVFLEQVSQAAFSPDQRFVATTGDQSVAHVWDIETSREVRTLRGHQELVGLVAFSPDGRWVATGARDGVVKLWSATDGRELFPLRNVAWGITVSRDGRLFTTGSPPEGTSVRETRTGRALVRLKVEHDYLHVVGFSPDGSRLVTSSQLHQPRVWDLKTGRSLFTLEGHTQAALYQAAFSPDGRKIVTSAFDNTTRIWDAETGRALRVFPEASLEVSGGQVFSPDSRWVANAARPPSADAMIWDIDTGQLVRRIRAHEGGCAVVIFSPDGAHLVTGGYDSTVRFWDPRSGALEKELPLRGYAVSLAFTGDGRRLFCWTTKTGQMGADIALIEIWDVAAGRQVMNMGGHTDAGWQLAISADGKQIVTGACDKTVRKWETFPWTEAEYPGSARTPLLSRVQAYADAYWRERLAAEAEARQQPEPDLVSLVPFDRAALPPRDPRTPAPLIDLTSHYNAHLDRPAITAWTADVDNDLRNLPAGVAEYAGVKFDVRGLILLRPRYKWGGVFQDVWDEWPLRVDGIPIRQRVRRLHLFHGAADPSDDGTAIAALVWHYADGQRHESEIIYGRHVRHWEASDADRGMPTQARLGWQGASLVAKDVRLYVASWDNPRPDAEVVSLDFVSRYQLSAPFLVAITVE